MPPKPTLHAYIALSLDGYIADATGAVKWLDKYNDPSLGFDAFYKTIDTVIVGRTTFEQALSWGAHDTAKRTIVLSEKTLDAPTPNVEYFQGDPKGLLRRLAREGATHIWHMGGGASLRPFVDANLIDQFHLFIIPILLGDGIPLFPKRDAKPLPLTLTRTKKHVHGVIELHYEPARRTRSAT
jgi:dihydrofolate reductase